MVYSTIKNRRFNYVQVIFDDMVAKLKETTRKKYVCYPRFFSAVLSLTTGNRYPTKGNYLHSTIGVKVLEPVFKAEDIPLRNVLVPATDVCPSGMSSNLASIHSHSSISAAMSVTNPSLTSLTTTTSSLKRSQPTSATTTSTSPKRQKQVVHKPSKI